MYTRRWDESGMDQGSQDQAVYTGQGSTGWYRTPPGTPPPCTTSGTPPPTVTTPRAACQGSVTDTRSRSNNPGPVLPIVAQRVLPRPGSSHCGTESTSPGRYPHCGTESTPALYRGREESRVILVLEDPREEEIPGYSCPGRPAERGGILGYSTLEDPRERRNPWLFYPGRPAEVEDSWVILLLKTEGSLGQIAQIPLKDLSELVQIPALFTRFTVGQE